VCFDASTPWNGSTLVTNSFFLNKTKKKTPRIFAVQLPHVGNVFVEKIGSPNFKGIRTIILGQRDDRSSWTVVQENRT
jgi:hypothetical protein